MSPTSKLASSPSEVGDVSLLACLEPYGGFGQNRELGMIQWSLAHIFDAAAKEEWRLVRDRVALTAVMVEQASLDANKWHLAWLLRVVDDPPPESVAQPGPDCNRSPPTICSTMCPDLDNDSFGLHEGSRCPLLKKNRALGRRGQGLIRSRFQDSSAESSAQAQTRERQRRVKQSVSERGKANLRPRGVLQLEEKCSHEDAFRGEDHACFSPCAEGVFLGTTIPVSMQANSLQKLQILCEEKLGFQNFPFPLQLGACQPQDGFFVRAQLWDDSCTLSLCRDGPMAPPTALLPLPLPCFRP